MNLRDEMRRLAREAKAASRELSRLSTEEKNRALTAMADGLDGGVARLVEANQRDLKGAAEAGLSGALLERLRLDEKRVAAMARGLREVAALPDPVGRILDERVRPNGLKLRKVSAPIGVVVIIYESRPNVTADAASLCLKAGSSVILRGGKEAIHSNQLIAEILRSAAREATPSFPSGALQVVSVTDRAAVPELLSLTEYVDLCMPRGGESLIRAVAECSKVPVIKHYKGVCHVYVDSEADLPMAASIAVNAKAQRPSVCNAMETLLVAESAAEEFLPLAADGLCPFPMELRLDDASRSILAKARPELERRIKLQRATEEDWFNEYNDYILNVRVVRGADEAIEHVNRFGSGHSDSIVTANEETARRFMAEVDSAAVYWNASTRFTDGGEFGMGAEIGISTDKVGARGPMGLEELTTYKWLAFGTGQIRT